jgi:hypothetical protein
VSIAVARVIPNQKTFKAGTGTTEKQALSGEPTKTGGEILIAGLKINH